MDPEGAYSVSIAAIGAIIDCSTNKVKGSRNSSNTGTTACSRVITYNWMQTKDLDKTHFHVRQCAGTEHPSPILLRALTSINEGDKRELRAFVGVRLPRQQV
jgi:hypothetical protein